jgi:pyridoxamine 5'-phosphate oxidase
MSLAPWRSHLTQALDRNRSLPYARYLQLATVRTDGRPANRTVVFRGFLEDTNKLKFITDSRSDKIEQIEHQSWGEACWYFPETREQFRIAGQLTLIKANHSDSSSVRSRSASWQELSDAARLQFTWPHPGKNRVEDSQAFALPLPDAVEPPPNFCLLLLEPTQVDHLELRGDPQNRCIYRLDSNVWSIQAINP